MSPVSPSDSLQQAEATLRALMLLGLSGDGAAQEQLLTQLSVLLRRFYQRRLHRNHAEVEDLVQETLIAVHTRRATYDAAQSFTAWAYAVARYKLIDYMRRQKLRDAFNIDDCAELFGADQLSAHEAERDVSEALSALPAAQREAIELTRLAGLSVEEAAAQSGQSVSSIKVGVHRGLKKLAALFGEPPSAH
jgi:RNA polymerase sigma-70 factor, ECF subfamily